MARTHARPQVPHGIAQTGQVEDRTARTLEQVGVDHELASDAGLGLFASREDVGDDGLVGHRQGPSELALQVARAREQMRLKDGDDPPVGAAARRLEGGRDLGRVMRVVVDHDHAVAATDLLVAPRRAAEPGKLGRRLVEAHADMSENGERGERVQHVVLTGHAQGDAAEPLTPAAHREDAALVVGTLDLGDQVGGTVLGAGAAVGPDHRPRAGRRRRSRHRRDRTR